MFEPNQRVKVNLSGLTIKGVTFSQNVQEALGTIIQRIDAEPPTYLVELLFSFKGIKRVEIPEERIRRAKHYCHQGGNAEAVKDALDLLEDDGSRKRGTRDEYAVCRTVCCLSQRFAAGDRG